VPLPQYGRVLFGKSPLRLVIGQVRFPALFRFSEKPFLAAFQKAIQPQYPRAAQENQIAVKFSAGKGVEPMGETLWRFNDREGAWSVVLGEGALTLESRRYTSVNDFLARFEVLLRAASEHLGIEERLRLGFRFINEIRATGANKLTDFAPLLNPKFVGFGGAPELLEGDVEQAFHDIRSRRPNGFFVIRHGLLTGTTVQPRAGDPPPESGPFYMIDLDYFDERETSLDINATIEQMRVYNEEMYQFFRWALDKGQLYATLEPTQ
jgi:uncharacterized protein (TIGR04255 family)